jgi:hypothetical protein
VLQNVLHASLSMKMRLIIVRFDLGNGVSGVSWGTSSAIGSKASLPSADSFGLFSLKLNYFSGNRPASPAGGQTDTPIGWCPVRPAREWSSVQLSQEPGSGNSADRELAQVADRRRHSRGLSRQIPMTVTARR